MIRFSRFLVILSFAGAAQISTAAVSHPTELSCTCARAEKGGYYVRLLARDLSTGELSSSEPSLNEMEILGNSLQGYPWDVCQAAIDKEPVCM